jgi:hypothetical protein
MCTFLEQRQSKMKAYRELAIKYPAQARSLKSYQSFGWIITGLGSGNSINIALANGSAGYIRTDGTFRYV